MNTGAASSIVYPKSRNARVHSLTRSRWRRCKIIRLGLALALAAFSVSRAQQSPAPSTFPGTPSSRTVRLSFVPPPMEGTISLGIYDENDQLVRVLHQEAEFDEFSIGDDALVTKWDGKDDFGYDVPAGTYSGRGFVVSRMEVNEIGAQALPSAAPSGTVRLKLVANPLENNQRPVIDLAAGFDDENAYIKTKDGLPLLTVANTGELTGIDAALAQNPDKSLTFYLRSGTTIRQFRVSGMSKMMAFDCGEFELK